MQLSTFQNAIISEVIKSEQNIVVNALAGSGKTFTAILAVQDYLKAHPTSKVCMCMFNKSIQIETSDKLDKVYMTDKRTRNQIKVRTSHSVGMSALRFGIEKQYGRNTYNIVVDENCHIADLMANVEAYSNAITNNADNKPTFVGNVKHLFDKCRVNLIKSNEFERIEWCAKHYGIHPIADEYNAVSMLLADAYELPTPTTKVAKDGTSTTAIYVDYIDMLTFAATHPFLCEKFDLFVVDECQDFNLAMHRIMLNCTRKGIGRFMAIGDPNQAINGFSGALNDSFDRFTRYDNVKVLPLSVNYRCGRNIIKLAQSLVPTIVAHDGACEGNVAYGCTIDNAQPNDYILSRKSAPLVKTALHLLASGKYCTIVGGADITKGLRGLIISACGKSKVAMTYASNVVYEKVDKYIKGILADMVAKGELQAEEANESKIAIELADKLACIKALADKADTMSDLLAQLDTLGKEQATNRAIKLMTAHKSKGLEADNVYIIDYDSMPMTWKGQQAWEYQQEENLLYVSWTRAKQNLYIC